MAFPKYVFGRCEESGHTGADATSVDHPNSETTGTDSGNGWPLVMFRGKYICKPCKRRLESEATSLQDAKKHEREDNFRSQVGFQRP